LARELFNEKTALVASVFVALAPFQVHYSQEIRMYSFLALWLISLSFAPPILLYLVSQWIPVYIAV
jgi:uncharacterized membrane protein